MPSLNMPRKRLALAALFGTALNQSQAFMTALLRPAVFAGRRASTGCEESVHAGAKIGHVA
jgi:hypothetical protein